VIDIGKDFSSGADLADPRKKEQAQDSLLLKLRHSKTGHQTIRSIFEMDQITIAAVNGHALGGGACIATACDFRIGAQNCLIGYPEFNLAMNLSWMALPLCVHLIGPARAKRMVILGNNENADTLLKWGFLDDVVPDDQLLARATEMAAAYSAQPPMAAQNGEAQHQCHIFCARSGHYAYGFRSVSVRNIGRRF
jgi:enoyl-CoA hydratase